MSGSSSGDRPTPSDLDASQASTEALPPAVVDARPSSDSAVGPPAQTEALPPSVTAMVPALPLTDASRQAMDRAVRMTRRHLLVLLGPAVVFLVACALGGYLIGLLETAPARLLVAAAWLLLVLIFCLRPWLLWLSESYLLFDNRLSVRTGVLRRRVADVPLSRVIDVKLTRTPRQRLLGLGSLQVETAGKPQAALLRDVGEDWHLGVYTAAESCGGGAVLGEAAAPESGEDRDGALDPDESADPDEAVDRDV